MMFLIFSWISKFLLKKSLPDKNRQASKHIVNDYILLLLYDYVPQIFLIKMPGVNKTMHVAINLDMCTDKGQGSSDFQK